MMLTSFISSTSLAYERHLKQLNLYKYQIKARLNLENFQVINMFKKQTNFKILFISIDKQVRINESKQWQGS